VSGAETEFTVPALLDGVRVDRAVALLTGVSRAQAAALVASGRVRSGGVAVVGRSASLRAGDLLVVDIDEAPDPSLLPEAGVVFDVVYEDEDLVVVDKPAGLVVHPGAGRTGGTMAAGLLARYPDLAGLVEAGICEPERPGIVHRLDRGTSGLLAVARTERAYRSLTAQLGARTVERRYLALVAGHVSEDRGVIDAPIGRSIRQPTRMAVSAQGREARTSYTVVHRYAEPVSSTLLVLALDTGRTHQIRVHLAAIGHPVLGDDRYGQVGAGGRGRVGGTLLPAGRLFLHAARLGFEHPATGETQRFDALMPPDLVAVIGPTPPLP
jgi:23S rRNA pseudouridine1911/1915/1917 synthase